METYSVEQPSVETAAVAEGAAEKRAKAASEVCRSFEAALSHIPEELRSSPFYSSASERGL